MEILTNKYKDILSLAYGIECSGGWNPIIDSVLGKLQRINESSKKDLKVVQVKQKFGRVRIYLRGETYSDNISEIEGILNDAAIASSMVCEKCGDAAKLRGIGAVVHVHRTLCDDCDSEMNFMLCADAEGGDLDF